LTHYTPLERWYADRCNGIWEHSYGVWIDTLDNPGWQARMSLRATRKEYAHLDKVCLDRNERDWIHYWVEGQEFHIACGPGNLSEAIEIFVQWFESD